MKRYSIGAISILAVAAAGYAAAGADRPPRTAPWMSGTVTYVSAAESTNLVAGTFTPVEGGLADAGSTATCPDLLDDIAAAKQGISLNIPMRFESDAPRSSGTGPFLAIHIDPNRPSDNAVAVFREPAIPALAEEQALESTDFSVDSETVTFSHPSEDRLLGNLTFMSAPNQNVNISMDLVCHAGS